MRPRFFLPMAERERLLDRLRAQVERGGWPSLTPLALRMWILNRHPPFTYDVKQFRDPEPWE